MRSPRRFFCSALSEGVFKVMNDIEVPRVCISDAASLRAVPPDGKAVNMGRMTKRPSKRAADMEQAQARFEAFLRGRNLKLTEERRSLVEAVFSEEHHFDADELHMNQRAEGSGIS